MSQETQTSGLKRNGGNSCLITSRWTKISLSWDREYKSAKRSSEQLIQWLLPGNTVSYWWLWKRKKKQKPRVLSRFTYFVPIDTGAEALHTRWAMASHSFVTEFLPRRKKHTEVGEGCLVKVWSKAGPAVATTKANTQESGADVKESGLFADAASRRGGLMSKNPSPHLSGGKAFYKEGEGNRTKRWRKGLKSSLHAN